MIKFFSRLHVVFRGIVALIFLLSFHFSHAQSGSTPVPKSSDNIRTTIKFNSSLSALTYDFNATDWYYIAFTKPSVSNGNGAFYVNGSYIGDIEWEDIVYDHLILNLGASGNTGNFSGSIDEIRVTYRIKDATEFESYFNSKQPFPKEINTAYIWRFDEGSGTKFYDEDLRTAGNLINGPIWVDGKFGKAIKYDGINDVARINVDLIENQVTYEFWVKFDGEVRSESQTILQPYGSTSSIDLSIEQTLIKPVPPARDDVVFLLKNLEESTGNQVVVPVVVDKFIDVLAVQHSVKWDPAILEYAGVQDFGLSDLDGTAFNLSNPGELSMAWTPSDAKPVTVTDQTTFYGIVFNVVGLDGENSDVTFSDNPTPREISDGNGDPASAVYKDGKVTISNKVLLEGYIKTQSGAYVPNVEVVLSGGDNQTTQTDEFGKYTFSVAPKIEYTITPTWTGAIQSDDGVTTLDLVIMHWHIVGTKYLMSNYDLIACDVIKNGLLSAPDVAETREVILHKKDKFRDKNAVEFISYQYTGTPDPFQYDNFITITPSTPLADLNFTIVKVGDAGRNWDANKSGGRYQNLEEFQIIVQSEHQSDENLKIALKSKDFDAVLGLQFTLEWDPEVYQFNEIDHQQIQFDINDGLANFGKMTFSWNTNDKDGLRLDDGEILSELMFAKVGNSDDSPISISSTITPALAFNSSLDMMKITQSNPFGEVIKNSKLSVYPNPSASSINISGLDPKESLDEFQIINSMGQVMMSGSLNGQNNISIEELSGGLYFLNLKSEQGQTQTLNFLKR